MVSVPSGCASASALDKLEETSLVKPRNEGSAQQANSTKIPEWGARTSSGFPRWLSPSDHHKDRVVRAELAQKKRFRVESYLAYMTQVPNKT